MALIDFALFASCETSMLKTIFHKCKFELWSYELAPFASLVQLVERSICNPEVVGSSPAGSSKILKKGL